MKQMPKSYCGDNYGPDNESESLTTTNWKPIINCLTLLALFFVDLLKKFRPRAKMIPPPVQIGLKAAD